MAGAGTVEDRTVGTALNGVEFVDAVQAQCTKATLELYLFGVASGNDRQRDGTAGGRVDNVP